MKTAEEILLQCCAGPEASPVWSHEEALDAMRKFAAQESAKEVEAYKAKLKNEIAGLIIGLAPSEEDWNKGWSKGLYDVVKLIDTVK